MKDYYSEIRRFMLATNKIDGAYYYFAKKIGVNENTLAVLYALDDGKPHSQKEICEEWLIPKTTISTIIRELIDIGYVNLVPGKHTKEKTIYLTEKGQNYVNKILPIVYEAEQQAMERTLQEFSSEFIEATERFSEYLCEEFNKREKLAMNTERQRKKEEI